MTARWNALAFSSVLAFAAALTGVTLILDGTSVPADGLRYRSMAESLLASGGFHADRITIFHAQPGEVENGHTHYFSPLWPVFAAPFVAALGDAGFQLAYLVAAALALATAYWTTRDLYGDASAFALTTILGLLLMRVTDQRSSEPLALAFFLLMLYGILRSIRPQQQAWILLAGAAAGAAYLTRASVGWVFLLGGAAGFAWRLRFHRRRALNRHYLGAIALFGACFAAWATRNLVLFWDGTFTGFLHAVSADAVFEWKFMKALQTPGRLLLMVFAKLCWGLVLLSPVILLRRRELWTQVKSLTDETQCGLFLAWAVPLLTGAIVSAIFTLADFDPPSPLLSLDNARYFLVAIPGLLWGPWIWNQRVQAVYDRPSTAAPLPVRSG